MIIKLDGFGIKIILRLRAIEAHTLGDHPISFLLASRVFIPPVCRTVTWYSWGAASPVCFFRALDVGSKPKHVVLLL